MKEGSFSSDSVQVRGILSIYRLQSVGEVIQLRGRKKNQGFFLSLVS